MIMPKQWLVSVLRTTKYATERNGNSRSSALFQLAQTETNTVDGLVIGIPVIELQFTDFWEQVTRGHIIVADGWAGAHNPHPHLAHPKRTYANR